MSTYLVDHMRLPNGLPKPDARSPTWPRPRRDTGRPSTTRSSTSELLGIALLVGTGVIAAAPRLLGFTAPTAAAAVSSPAG
jgi:hypothetical protein